MTETGQGGPFATTSCGQICQFEVKAQCNTSSNRDIRIPVLPVNQGSSWSSFNTPIGEESTDLTRLGSLERVEQKAREATNWQGMAGSLSSTGEKLFGYV